MALSRLAVIGLALLLAVAPLAQAHGAVPPREVDTRLLLDDEGLVDYGGCVEGQCSPGEAPGLDLLTLDAREAFLPDGRPALVWLVIFQAPTEGVADRSVRIAWQAGGTPYELTILDADTPTATAAGVDRLVGPFPVGDGHPQGIEAWFAYATLGVKPGDALEQVVVQSSRGTTVDDEMPGGWYANGVPVPHVPHSTDPGEATEEHPPGQYTLKGPAPLLKVDAPEPDDVQQPSSYTIRVTNPLQAIGQTVTPVLPAGLAIQPEAVRLEPGQARLFNVTASTPGELAGNVTFASDLGAYQGAPVRFFAPVPQGNTTTTTSAKAKDSPAPGALLVAPLLLVAVAGLRRRR